MLKKLLLNPGDPEINDDKMRDESASKSNISSLEGFDNDEYQ